MPACAAPNLCPPAFLRPSNPTRTSSSTGR
jgi:hypothetical protein